MKDEGRKTIIMPYELKIPEVGESIREVQIGQWLKQEGQWAEKDESLLQIESDKATVDLPAPAAGVVTKILKREGEVAAVGEIVGYLEETVSPTADSTAKTPPPAEPVAHDGRRPAAR